MNIYCMNLDGGDLRPFVVMKGFAKNARWSHDGRSVVFHGSDLPDFYELSPAARGDSIAIFTTDRYGGNLKRVSQSPYGAVHPGW